MSSLCGQVCLLCPCVCSGGLDLAIEGPSKAEISCVDNKDGTCSVSYLPTLPGDYNILVKYNEDHIPGSPFTARITGQKHVNVHPLSLMTARCPQLSHRTLCFRGQPAPLSGQTGLCGRFLSGHQ